MRGASESCECFERSFKSTLKHDLISTRIREAHVGGGA